MSDQEFAEWLRTYPREVTPEEVEHRGRVRDKQRGEYIGQQEHHEFGEARH